MWRKILFALLAALALVVVVGIAIAAPASDVIVTTDTAVTVTGYSGAEAWAGGGTCTYKLVNAADDTVRYYYGRTGVARDITFTGLGVVEMYIDVHDADEVIYTLK